MSSTIPPQGFRHAVALLLTSGARGIGAHEKPEAVRAALESLAHQLAALANDTRAQPGTSPWLIAELNALLDHLPHAFDRESAKSACAEILSKAMTVRHEVDTRDLFLVYLAEDRLPLAAPLAVELTKRRVSVALAEYEVENQAGLSAAIAHGLSRHRGGVLLVTAAFDRAHLEPPSGSERIRILRHPELFSAVSELSTWAARLRLSKS